MRQYGADRKLVPAARPQLHAAISAAHREVLPCGSQGAGLPATSRRRLKLGLQVQAGAGLRAWRSSGDRPDQQGASAM